MPPFHRVEANGVQPSCAGALLSAELSDRIPIGGLQIAETSYTKRLAHHGFTSRLCLPNGPAALQQHFLQSPSE